MYMLGIVLTRLQQRATSVIFSVMASIIKLRCKLLGAPTTHMIQSVDRLCNQHAQIEQTPNPLAAQSTTVARSNKAERTTAKAKRTARGQRRRTTAPQTHHHAIVVPKKGK